jgi:hypothetical protein
MPNGDDRDLIRMLSTIGGFRILYGRWPKCLRLEPCVIRDLNHFLSQEELSSLNDKIQIVPLDDEDFIAEDDEGHSYSLMEYGHPLTYPDIDPAEWLGLPSYIKRR